MKKVKENVLNATIKAMITRLESVEKFALDQAPDICKEMIIEKKIDIALDLPMPIAGVIIAGILLFVGYNAPSIDPAAVSGLTKILDYTGACLFASPSIDSLLKSVNWLIFINKCPKLYLLREFRNLLE